MSSAEEINEPHVKEGSPDNISFVLGGTSDNPSAEHLDESPANPPADIKDSSDSLSSIQTEAAKQDSNDTDSDPGTDSDIEVIDEEPDSLCILSAPPNKFPVEPENPSSEIVDGSSDYNPSSDLIDFSANPSSGQAEAAEQDPNYTDSVPDIDSDIEVIEEELDGLYILAAPPNQFPVEDSPENRLVDASSDDNPSSDLIDFSDPSSGQAEAAEQDPNDTDSNTGASTVSDSDNEVIVEEPDIVYSRSAPPNLLNHPYVTPPFRIGADGHPIFPYKSLSERIRLEDLNNPPPPPEEPKPKFEDSDSSYEHSPPFDPDTRCQFLDDEPL